jgi:hypothetical protein
LDSHAPGPDEAALARLYRRLRASDIDVKLGDGLGDVEREIALAELRRRRGAARWSRPVLFVAACVVIDLAINKLLGEAPLPMGQLMRSIDDGLIAVLLTASLWALASLFGAQSTSRRLLKILAVLAMLALTLPLAMCAMVVGVQFT